MFIKVCGNTNIEDALLSVELGASAIGFIFYKKSPRFVPFDTAKKIIQLLPTNVFKIGVFVDHPINELNSISKKIELTHVQLHGNESPSYVDNVHLPVIKGFRIKNDFDFTILNQYSNCTFLLDAYQENKLGGTGIQFDWNIIPAQLKEKIILAGGISPQNINEIFATINPYGIDLVSSLEKYPGKKDELKMKEFFKIYNELRK